MANYPAFQPLSAYQQMQPVYSPVAPIQQPSYAPMYQPTSYQPTIQPVPQQQQPLQSSMPTVRGRIVNREEEITPNEVAMDGQVSLFPLADYSCIVAKFWDSNGQMQAVKFVPLMENAVEQEVENKSDMILGRLDDIESLIKKNSRPTYKKNQNGSRNVEKENDDA